MQTLAMRHTLVSFLQIETFYCFETKIAIRSPEFQFPLQPLTSEIPNKIFISLMFSKMSIIIVCILLFYIYVFMSMPDTVFG